MVCTVEANCVFCEVRTELLYRFVYFSLQIVRSKIETNVCIYEFNLDPSKPSGHYIYRQFSIQQFYVLLTQCVYVFCVDLRTNSYYFPIKH